MIHSLLDRHRQAFANHLCLFDKKCEHFKVENRIRRVYRKSRRCVHFFVYRFAFEGIKIIEKTAATSRYEWIFAITVENDVAKV